MPWKGKRDNFGEAASIWVFPVPCYASDAPAPRCFMLLQASPHGSVEEQPCVPRGHRDLACSWRALPLLSQLGLLFPRERDTGSLPASLKSLSSN